MVKIPKKINSPASVQISIVGPKKPKHRTII